MITDSNRRRVLVPSRLAQNAGPVLAAGEEPSVDAAVLDPFGKGPDAQTVAVYGGGITGVSAPSSPGYPQFPENRPFAALDGDPATHWQADRALTPDRHVLTVRFDKPRDVPYVYLRPYDDSRVKVTAVEIAGRRYAVRAGAQPAATRPARRQRPERADHRRPGARPDDHGRHPRAADPGHPRDRGAPRRR